MFNEVKPNQTLLLMTKLNRPVLGSGLVARPELYAHLDASKRLPLILVSAPAGYGKSTLVNSYLNIVDWPAAWISLDEHDNNLITFMQYFLAAIQSIIPGACKATGELLYSDETPAAEILAATVVNEINIVDRDFFVVLDDYSHVHDLQIHNLLSKILRHPPHSMHLVITTRRDPPLPLINLRAQNRMAEIRAPELRFNLRESASLIKNICGPHIDDGTIAALYEITEGWITALYLAAIAYQGADMSQQRGFQPENEKTINEYLVNEFYSRLPLAIQDFLLRISILDRICGSLCEAVCREGDSPVPLVSGLKYLDWAKSENLLLFSLDNENRWYQLHRLFRRFLQSRLQDHFSPEDIAMFHSKASAWFNQNQQYDQALPHSLAAGDVKTGIQMVARSMQSIRLPEKWPQLENMLSLFSQQVIENSPELLLAEAWVMCARFLPGKVTAVLKKAEELISETKMEPSRLNLLLGQTAALHSYLSYWTGDYQNVLSQGEKALAMLSEEWSYIRGLISIQMAYARPLLQKNYFSNKYIDEGVKQILKILTKSPIPLEQQEQLCFFHWINADLYSLKLTAENLISNSCGNGPGRYAAMGYHFLGTVFYHQNDLAQAEKYYRMAWESKHLLSTLFLSQTAFGLASAYYSQGRHNKVYEIVNTAVACLLEMEDPNIMYLIQAFQAELAVSQDDYVTTNNWIEQFDKSLIPPMITFYYPHFTLLKIFFKQDTEERRMQAFDILNRLKDFAESSHNKNYLIKILVWEALFQKSSGDEVSALSALKQALNLAKPGGFVRLFMAQEPCLSNLLQKLDNHHNPFIEQISNTLEEDVGYTEANNSLIVPLTDRELNVLAFLIKRLTNKEIAGQLNISTGTVKSHTIRIYQKLSVNNRREAVGKALSIGLKLR